MLAATAIRDNGWLEAWGWASLISLPLLTTLLKGVLPGVVATLVAPVAFLAPVCAVASLALHHWRPDLYHWARGKD